MGIDYLMSTGFPFEMMQMSQNRGVVAQYYKYTKYTELYAFMWLMVNFILCEIYSIKKSITKVSLHIFS